MQHRRDAANEEAKKANSIAEDTADALDEQQNKLDEVISLFKRSGGLVSE